MSKIGMCVFGRRSLKYYSYYVYKSHNQSNEMQQRKVKKSRSIFSVEVLIHIFKKVNK